MPGCLSVTTSLCFARHEVHRCWRTLLNCCIIHTKYIHTKHTQQCSNLDFEWPHRTAAGVCTTTPDPALKIHGVKSGGNAWLFEWFLQPKNGRKVEATRLSIMAEVLSASRSLSSLPLLCAVVSAVCVLHPAMPTQVLLLCYILLPHKQSTQNSPHAHDVATALLVPSVVPPLDSHPATEGPGVAATAPCCEARAPGSLGHDSSGAPQLYISFFISCRRGLPVSRCSIVFVVGFTLYWRN